MTRSLLALVALALVALSCAPSSPPTDAGVDACSPATATEACVIAFDAVCGRILECCSVSPRPAQCPSWTTTRECRAALAARDPSADCATATGAPRCRAAVESCAARAAAASCSDWLAGTARVVCD